MKDGEPRVLHTPPLPNVRATVSSLAPFWSAAACLPQAGSTPLFSLRTGTTSINPRRKLNCRCDALAAEFSGRGTAFGEPLKDTHDGLRGFEITDPDGHVLFFGRPRK